MLYSLILPGLELSLKNFIEQHLPISSTNVTINDFDGFLKSINDEIINERKDELLEFFIHRFLLKNGILSYINKTFIYFSQGNYRKISDGNIDIHGQYKILFFLIRSKWLNPNYKVEVEEVRKLLNVISKKPETFIGFLVTNVPLSDYAQNELEESILKHRICVCYFDEIVDKILEYAQILEQNQEEEEMELEKRKRKCNELEWENNFLREENKKLNEESNEEFDEASFKKLKDAAKDLEDKIEVQSKEINGILDLILKKLG
ncbi:20085_t:CDS:2 [Cetraspora pellucida]|uniref:20085_t:CDS:1 n=1 Tax=Cetraspora pellucida TaxID=1433469 RepID=A0A9N9EA29_9GLOM|nr:20085_t:CDS:2 [Cetraspora pellucida]